MPLQSIVYGVVAQHVSFGSRLISSPATIAMLCAVGVLCAYIAGGILGVGTAEHEFEFSPLDEPWFQYLSPALDTPFSLSRSPSSLVARSVLTRASGRRGVLRELAAACGAATAGLAISVLWRLGIPLLPSALAVLAMALGPTFWWRGVVWTPGGWAPIFGLLAALAVARWLERRTAAAGMLATLLAGLAVADDATWLVFLPPAAIFLWDRRRTSAQRLGVAAVGALILCCAAFPMLSIADLISRAQWGPEAPANPPAIWAVVTGRAANGTSWRVESHAGTLTASITALPRALSRECGPLGIGLLLVGVACVSRCRQHRLVALTLLSALIVRYGCFASSNPGVGGVPVALALWGCIGVGLRFVRDSIGPTAGSLVIAVLSMLMGAFPVISASHDSHGSSPENQLSPVSQASKLTLDQLPPNLAFVSYSRRADAALAVTSEICKRPLVIFPQHTPELDQALAWGQPLLAWVGSRALLEPIGFLFARDPDANSQLVRMVGRRPCTSLSSSGWTDVSAVTDDVAIGVWVTSYDERQGRTVLYLSGPDRIEVHPLDRYSRRVTAIVLQPSVAPPDEVREAEAALGNSGDASRDWPVTRITIPAALRPAVYSLGLSATPRRAVARPQGTAPVEVCGNAAGHDPVLSGSIPATAVLDMSQNDLFGPGWYTPEGAGTSPWRWTSMSDSWIRVRLARPGRTWVAVTASALAPLKFSPKIGITVNACQIPAKPMQDGPTDTSWLVEAGCWRTGINALRIRSNPILSPSALGTSRDARSMGAAVSKIQLERRSR